MYKRQILSTIHSAKGLEYDRVILLDVLDGILPAKPELACRTPGETQQYEEDRRLFYVAMTLSLIHIFHADSYSLSLAALKSASTASSRLNALITLWPA